MGRKRSAAYQGQKSELSGALSLAEVRALGTDQVVIRLWKVNWLAKSDNHDWYKVKTNLVFELLARLLAGHDEAVLAWGVGLDRFGRAVLYVDLIGYGQFSFHIWWLSKAVLVALPKYQFEWTGIARRGCERRAVSPESAQITLRGFLSGLYRELLPGDVHNICVCAGVSPERVWAS